MENNEGIVQSLIYQLVVKYGIRYASSNSDSEKQNLVMAMSILTHAGMIGDDSKAKRLISLARQVSKGEVSDEIQK